MSPALVINCVSNLLPPSPFLLILQISFRSFFSGNSPVIPHLSSILICHLLRHYPFICHTFSSVNSPVTSHLSSLPVCLSSLPFCLLLLISQTWLSFSTLTSTHSSTIHIHNSLPPRNFRSLFRVSDHLITPIRFTGSTMPISFFLDDLVITGNMTQLGPMMRQASLLAITELDLDYMMVGNPPYPTPVNISPTMMMAYHQSLQKWPSQIHAAVEHAQAQ